jgi:hypothetical protein
LDGLQKKKEEIWVILWKKAREYRTDEQMNKEFRRFT